MYRTTRSDLRFCRSLTSQDLRREAERTDTRRSDDPPTDHGAVFRKARSGRSPTMFPEKAMRRARHRRLARRALSTARMHAPEAAQQEQSDRTRTTDPSVAQGQCASLADQRPGVRSPPPRPCTRTTDTDHDPRTTNTATNKCRQHSDQAVRSGMALMSAACTSRRSPTLRRKSREGVAPPWRRAGRIKEPGAAPGGRREA